jgi:hypothetical protein
MAKDPNNGTSKDAHYKSRFRSGTLRVILKAILRLLGMPVIVFMLVSSNLITKVLP